MVGQCDRLRGPRLGSAVWVLCCVAATLAGPGEPGLPPAACPVVRSGCLKLSDHSGRLDAELPLPCKSSSFPSQPKTPGHQGGGHTQAAASGSPSSIPGWADSAVPRSPLLSRPGRSCLFTPSTQRSSPAFPAAGTVTLSSPSRGWEIPPSLLFLCQRCVSSK